MAFDGVTIAALVKELREKLQDGRIFKIAQPEKDELLLTIKNQKQQYRLQISAGAALPLMYIASEGKQSPLTAPNFCMLLRKHVSNGRIISITQPDFERIVDFEIEHLNELGDICRKHLVVELMGKHSNIIFVDDNHRIIDSIKHISFNVSSVREVLPDREYFIPKTTEKKNPLLATEAELMETLFQDSTKISVNLYKHFTGLSPSISSEICAIADVDGDLPANFLDENSRLHLCHMFVQTMDEIREEHFSPNIVFRGKEPMEFCAIPMTSFPSDYRVETNTSISHILETYYSEKDKITRIRQRSADLRQIVQTALAKDVKKFELQQKQLKDTEKRDKYQLYGELLTAYAYQLEGGVASVEVQNYYDNTSITIPMDKDLTPMENAKHYYEKYGKMKRTYEALSEIIKDTKEEIEHLESISTALDIAPDENSLKELKEELVQYGYIRRKPSEKKAKYVSKPLHYIASNGMDIYVGKNNFQNEELTFKIATGGDWWFHAKGIPGSHVIVKAGTDELPDEVYEEAARLAAFYSKGRGQDKVEIDYIQRKHVKKVNGAKPGFVIYHTNYSMMAIPDIDGIKEA